MEYKEVELHGFETQETLNVGTDYGGDIPEDRGTQLNLKYSDGSVFAVPYRDGKQAGDKGYIISGKPEAWEIAQWYRSEICGLVADPTAPKSTEESEADAVEP